MIRQAHTYLVSAMSGATLIAIAIAAFVFLVSAQVFRDWPIAALGGNGDAGVSKAKPVADGASAGAAGVATGPAAGAKAGTRSGGGGASSPGQDARRRAELGEGRSSGDIGAVPAGTAPVTQPGGSAGSPADGGGAAPQSPSQPASGGAGGGSASSGGGQSGAGGGGSGGGGGESGGGGSAPSTTPPPSTSGAVTETVNGAVNQVDEAALGGTLGSTGVTGVTEGVVNGVAGPESTVGKVVDETVNTVGKLLGGNR
ncbi:MAG TPA: hypothetical protein VHA54_12625 [Solirubrobacterales bacterium]|nr:hypothetical protein [Solirubrobacterales bacterium]